MNQIHPHPPRPLTRLTRWMFFAFNHHAVQPRAADPRRNGRTKPANAAVLPELHVIDADLATRARCHRWQRDPIVGGVLDLARRS